MGWITWAAPASERAAANVSISMYPAETYSKWVNLRSRRLTDRRSAASNSAGRSRPSRDNMTPDCNQGQSKRAVGGPLQRFGRRPPDGIVKRRVPLWTNFICRHERIYDWH